MVTRLGLAACVALAIGFGGACGGDTDRVVVFAASSLTDAFDVIESDFERARPDVDIVISYAGSSSLAAQIEQGAPVDVVATADLSTMERITAATGVTAAVFAHNRLAIAVERGNPRSIGGLADLARPELVVVIAAPEVPAGAYATDVADAVGVAIDADSLEQNVRAVAAKVALGEADAGVVYRTDIAADRERLDEVALDTDLAAEYPIAVLSDRSGAVAFAEFVTGDDGRAALADAGFEVP